MEYQFHRFLGLGSGFSKGTTLQPTSFYVFMQSVTATDKYTVVFKAKTPTLDLLFGLTDDMSAAVSVFPREVVETYSSSDKRSAIGTGPFMLEDYVASSSLTVERNPDYWGFDDRYPENKLPYFDKVKWLVIPDNATALAALRSGKIDLIENITWDQAVNLAKSNPELRQVSVPTFALSLSERVDIKPYNDIRVRKALQMAIDLKTIAQTYYGGTASELPSGIISPAYKAYCMPYDMWEQEVKDGFAYNPEGAKKLLAEAGYPSGFQTNVVAPTTADMAILEIVKDYLLQIGVDMEIRVMDPVAFTAFVQTSKKHDAMAYQNTASTLSPTRVITFRTIIHPGNWSNIKDPVYEQMAAAIIAASTREEQKKLTREADYYGIKQYWNITLNAMNTYSLFQQRLKGFWGQVSLSYGALQGSDLGRMWIDEGK
jgi:peptide/nickel transport system substrate-binding protein